MICCLIGASCPLTYWRRPLLLHGHDKRGSARRADTHKTSKREKKELGEGEKTWKTSSVFICWFVCFSFLFFLFVAMDAPASRTLSSLSLVYKQPAQKGEEEEEVKLLLSLERRTREFLFGSLYYSSIGLLVSSRRRARYSIRIDYTNLLDFFSFFTSFFFFVPFYSQSDCVLPLELRRDADVAPALCCCCCCGSFPFPNKQKSAINSTGTLPIV